jgi:hypothetical protein
MKVVINLIRICAFQPRSSIPQLDFTKGIGNE